MPRGNYFRPSAEVRFWSKVDATGDCWLWTASTIDGYGIFTIGGGNRVAHSYAYETLVGVIPKDLQLDHLCRNRSCVNPDHLQPVSGLTNINRGFSPSSINKGKTHCLRGHPFDLKNTYQRPRPSGGRDCRACMKVRSENAQN